MTDESTNCRNCGAPLKPGARYCEACGQAVDVVTTPTTYLENTPPPPPPPPSPPSTPPPVAQPVSFSPGTKPPTAAKSRFPVWLIIVLVLVVLCICGVLVAGLLYFTVNRGAQSLSTSLSTDVAPLNLNDTVETFGPSMPVAPPHSGQTLNRNQIFDDFSSQELGWDSYSDETANLGYEDGRYFVQVMDSEWIVWSYLPVDFYPTAIEFDAQIPQPYTSNGTLGVMCLIQDDQNYYYVDIDVDNGEYQIGQSVNDEYVYLSENEWETAGNLVSDPTAVNHYAVTCDPNQISLFINGQFENQAVFSSSAPQGDMAVYAFSWDGMDDNGLKVYFDNVDAWQQ